jgi:hypothetical protein
MNHSNPAEIVKKLNDSIATGKAAFDAAEKWIEVLAQYHDVEINPLKSRIHDMEFNAEDLGDEKIMEGLFDGKDMVTTDNQTYPVPANYASKSKLVEGDKLKLTIKPNGAFVYKQIELVPRKLITGKLILDGSQYKVLTDIRSYHVLYASVTFFRASVGDTITVTIPEDGIATWGAIENVLPEKVEAAA